MGDHDELASYGLTALQHGMLYHALSNPGSGVDIEQVYFRLAEELEADRFEAAWKSVVARHDVLRTSFDWAGADEPRQVVRPAVSLPFRYLDWSGLDLESLDAEFTRLRREDRLVDFALNEPPLMRMTLVRAGPRNWLGLWTFHHALLDGRSFPLVLGEVFDLYDGSAAASLPDRRPFRDHVEFLRARDVTSDEQFWTEYLDGFDTPTSIDIPTRTGPGPGPFGAVEWNLAADTTEGLRRFASAHDLSLNTLIQTAWSLLLHHYSGRDDVAFGVTRACRRSSVSGAETMVGLLINTVPMRVLIQRDVSSLLELLKSVRRQQQLIREVEHSPLPAIQGWSELPAGVAVFDTIVVYDDQSLGARMKAQGAHPEQRSFEYQGQTNYPVTLLAYGDDQLQLRVEYSTARLDDRSAGRLVRQLATLLEAFPDHANAPAVSVPYLTEEEQVELSSWNSTARDYDLDTCLQYLFEEQVARDPQADAVVFGEQRLSYDQLNRRSNRLAHYLQARGVGRNHRIGVCAERSLELVVALYGIIKSGAAYVPLDPEYPADRLGYMIEDSDVPVILTQEHLVGRLPRYQGEIIRLDTDWPSIATSPDDNPDHASGPADLAYVLYTSGSTGRPKGVMNEHRGIVNRLLWMQEAYGLDDSDRVLQKTPFSFDVSVWEFFWPLQVGSQLIVAEPGGHRDGAYLVRTIQQQDITTLHFVPSMLQLLIEEPNLEACRSLRRVICSGEALPRDLQDRLLARIDVELHNLYGPTEAAVDVSWWPCDPESDLDFIPIGRAISNTQLYVLDRALQPVPVGVAGELHIGGVQVARGYLNLDELTAAKFIPDPFRRDENGRLYKTGDLARFMPDGNIEFLGRLDHQVKIRGFRIELGEIESVISGHHEIKEAVVLAREDTPGDKRLVAYIVPTVSTPDLEDLRQLLRSQLAEYMVPASFVVLDSFPLTSNGKIDRKALPAPTAERAGEISLPESEAERRVASIWSSILDLEEVGTRDTFFSLGGHSLLVMRLANQLAAAFDREVAVADIFRFPTVEHQARFLTEVPPPDEALAGLDAATQRQRNARKQQRRRAQLRRPSE